MLLDTSSIGSRVVVRRRMADGSAADILGDLVAVRPNVLTVQPDDAPALDIDTTTVLAAKPVPPRAVRPTSSMDKLQRLAQEGWPGLEQQRLGGWVMRAAGGFTGRANAALPCGDPGVPLDEAVAVVTAFYRARGLQPRFQVPFGVRDSDDPAPGFDTYLADRGWTHDAPTLMMTADLRRLSRSASTELPVRYRHTDSPDDAWLALYHYRGGNLPPLARRVMTAAPALYLTALIDDEIVGIGRLALTRDWVGVTAIEVLPAWRRRGLGSALTCELLRIGLEHDARFCYLQVFEHNAPAVPMYRSIGFTTHHRYHYRTAPDLNSD